MTGFDKQRRLRQNTELIKYKIHDGDEYGSGQLVEWYSFTVLAWTITPA